MTLVGACLSLTGRYARFGTMAASGLKVWAAMQPDVALMVEDDRSERELVRPAVLRLAGRCDVLLGPYSTVLTREACAVVGEEGLFLWNHGGAGDDVQQMALGHVASVLTPASLYAAPLIEWLVGLPDRAALVLKPGRGRFGRQIVEGARSAASRLGLPAMTVPVDLPERWDLLCAGSFDEDLEAIRWAQNLPRPPDSICAVAAGIREFGRAVGDPTGILGLAQCFPGTARTSGLGPPEADFLSAYRKIAGGDPDYPAVQAAAAAELALRCTAIAGSQEPASLWAVASRLRATTFFGAYALDPDTGLQTGHRTTLVCWTGDGLQGLG